MGDLLTMVINQLLTGVILQVETPEMPANFLGEDSKKKIPKTTVDGWNPVNSPVEVGSLSYSLPGF